MDEPCGLATCPPFWKQVEIGPPEIGALAIAEVSVCHLFFDEGINVRPVEKWVSGEFLMVSRGLD